MLLQYLPLKALNNNDDSFRITYAPELEELKQSICAVDLINPILVRHTQDGTYQIISGYKRYLVFEELEKQNIACLIYEANELSPEKAFLLNVHDNASARTLNLIEKYNVLDKLKQLTAMREDEHVDKIMPLLGEMPSYKAYHQLLSLNQLTEPMKRHALQQNIALSAASRIAEFTPSTQQALLGVLSKIQPSTAKLNELLNLIREISARDGMSVEDILSRYRLLEVVTNQESSALEKTRALREALRGIRLPKLTERQRYLTDLIDGLNLPMSAKIHTDPYFENEKIKLEYQFSQPEELDELVKKIQVAFKKQRWQQIFDWYKA